MKKKSMVHMNANQFCAIDISTSDPDPLIGDVFQISIVPLDAALNFFTIPFSTLVKPDGVLFDSKDNVHQFKLAHVSGLEQEMVWDLFDKWFASLKLREGKQLVPLCWNWTYIKPFLVKLFGDYNFNVFFSEEIRDLYTITNFFNDRADVHALDIPFPKREALTNVINRLEIEIDGETRDPLYRCKLLAEAYKEFCLDKTAVIL